MSIDWNHYTPWASLCGGLLIGLATALYLLGTGRIAGIAGIVAGPLRALLGTGAWSLQRVPLLFIAGLLIAPHLWRLVAPLPVASVDVGPLGWVAAGLLVGVGVRMANGCTSGHGVCGLSRFSLRSLVNVITFMGAGAVTVFVLRHLV
ncbi:MAG: YeeE/YedE family protein [Burkholderiaceae bacterium]|nr:YeeE/YedE family protein [Burkholderiaceae bacterium]